MPHIPPTTLEMCTWGSSREPRWSRTRNDRTLIFWSIIGPCVMTELSDVYCGGKLNMPHQVHFHNPSSPTLCIGSRQGGSECGGELLQCVFKLPLSCPSPNNPSVYLSVHLRTALTHLAGIVGQRLRRHNLIPVEIGVVRGVDVIVGYWMLHLCSLYTHVLAVHSSAPLAQHVGSESAKGKPIICCTQHAIRR